MFKKFVLFVFLSFGAFDIYGQVVTVCPQNIGFENGQFTSWELYTGIVGGSTNPSLPTGQVQLNSSGQSFNRHQIVKRSEQVDRYGGFSLNAPNGSDYVVKLGNDEGGAQAEAISYTINVPSDLEAYSVIFNYAVVFESPNHEPDQQPRFTAKVYDMTTNSSTSCGSFDFVAPKSTGGVTTGLPGFTESPFRRRDTDPILYKPWSPVLVNLSDYIGHTIKLEFTTNDCTFMRHFGYAYIDFNENCSIPITGNVVCPEVTSTTLKALPGFSGYRWFNDRGDVLGTADSLVLSPTPAPGTRIGVELVPYDGLGCTQTLYTVIESMRMSIKDPPPNCSTLGVDLTDISLKAGNSSDLTYTYWTDANATKKLDNPKHISIAGYYYVKGTSSSGCFKIQRVRVIITDLNPILVQQPKPVAYPSTVDITRTFVHEPYLNYSYWVKQDTSIRITNPRAIRFSGTFYIKASGLGGCECFAPVTVIVDIPEMIIPNTFTPNGDGVNDVFTILVNSKYKVSSLSIFTRYGEPVFITADISNFWDGLKENSKMPVGVYYWVMEGSDTSQKKFLRAGYVTVIR